MTLTETLLVAHRGESHDAPENTHAAFDLAWQRQCAAIELDVHLTADGHVVVAHDAHTQRTAGVQHVIAQTPLATLQTLDVGAWKALTFAGERMPLLDEVLARVPAGRQVFLEIKSGVETVEPVAQILERCSEVAVTVIAFGPDVVRAAKQRLPHLKVLWLISPKRDESTGQWNLSGAEILRRAKDLGADGIDLDHRFDIDQALVDAAHAGGMSILVWTVDDLARARELAALGIDGITSNRAAWLRDQP